MTTRRHAPRTPQSVQLAVALCASALLFVAGSGFALAAGTGTQPRSAGPIMTERPVDFAAVTVVVEPSPQHGVSGVDRSNGVPVAQQADPGDSPVVTSKSGTPAPRRSVPPAPAPRAAERPKSEKPKPPTAAEKRDDDGDDHETITPPVRDEDEDDEDSDGQPRERREPKEES